MAKQFMLLALCATLTIAYVMAGCPNSCSGHGTCGENNICSCYPDYGDADCSIRACPYGLNPASGEVVECSARGSCDRKNGDCKCDAGYEGEECGRQACPNDCSGHGTCTGEGARHCVCDVYYSGADCSSRLCPRGDDPITKETYSGSGKSQQDEIQRVAITLAASGFTIDGDFVLTFTDAYGGSWTTRPIAVRDSGTTLEAKTVEDILESLPNQAIPDVTVSKGTFSDSVNTYDITFNSGANSGDVNALSCKTSGCDINGCQPRYTGVLKKKSFTSTASSQYAFQFFGDNAAEQSLTVDAAVNALIATSTTVLDFDHSPFTTTKTPAAGATISFSFNGGATTTTTVTKVSPATGKITCATVHGVSAATSNSLVIKFSNPANIVAYHGHTGFTMAEILGQAAADGAKGLSVVVATGASTITAAGTAAASVDFTTFVAVGDKIRSTDAFVHADDKDATLVVTNVVAGGIRVTKGGAAITAKAAVTTGATSGMVIYKAALSSVLSTFAVGDTVEFSGTTKNNGKFSVTHVDGDGGMLGLGGNVVTESLGTALTAVRRAKPASTELSCSVTESKKGTKETAVCGGRGSCDGSAGTCACYSGYTGENCDQQVQEM